MLRSIFALLLGLAGFLATSFAFAQAPPGNSGGVFSSKSNPAAEEPSSVRVEKPDRVLYNTFENFPPPERKSPASQKRDELSLIAFLQPQPEQLPPGAAPPAAGGFLPSVPPVGVDPGGAVRLPPIDSTAEPLQPYFFNDEPPANAVPPGRLNPYKNTFFQKLSLTGTWLPTGRGNNDLGVTEVDAFVTVAVPFPIVEWPLLISPTFNTRLLSGQHVSDLPPQLYETFVDFTWVPQFLPRWRGLFAVTPSLYTDFQHNDPQAFRIQGKALFIWDFLPDRLQVVGGLLYLDRADVVMLPAGGVIWTPTDWLRWEVIFPRPRLAQRFNLGLGFEDWAYVTVEWGGNTYSIERLSGATDRVTWKDFRLLAGVERKMEGGAGYRLEAGYVIGRTVEYTSHNGDFDPPNTFLVRGGITF